MSKKAGRNPIGRKAMTGVEKNRRMLAKRKLLNDAAKEHDYQPTTVLLNSKQLAALKELEQSWGGEFDSKALNHALFRVIKYALEHTSSDLKTLQEDDWPQYCDIDMIYIDAALKFKDWEQRSQTSGK